MAQPSGPLHSEEIKAQLRIKFGSLTAFERRRRLPDGSVRDCLRNGRPEVEKVIAKELGYTPERLWPGRFVRRGRNLRSTIVDSDSMSPRAAARQNAGAV